MTVPVRRRDLEAVVPRVRTSRSVVAEPQLEHAAPNLRPLAARPAAERVPRTAFGTGTYTSPYTDSVASRRAPGRRTPPPWTDPNAAGRARWGMVALALGLLGVVLGLAPSTGLLPRVLPETALGTVPVFSLAGALLGVVAIGLGAVGMFRAEGVGRPLLFGVIGTSAGAAAVLVGLVL